MMFLQGGEWSVDAARIQSFGRPEAGGSVHRPRPFMKWLGGKRRLLPEIVPRLPRRFRCYHEPFIGGGALLFALGPGWSYISDANPEVVNVYNVIKHKVHALIADLGRHRAGRRHYLAVRGMDRDPGFRNLPDVLRASRFIYLNKTAFNGLVRVNRKGQCNSGYGNYRNPKIFDAHTLLACHRALRRTRITCASYLAVEKIARPGDFVYFDPPYVPVSATADFVGYTAQGFTVEDHMALGRFCRRLDRAGCLFMVSNSDTPLVRDLYQSFWIHGVMAPRSVARDPKSRGMVREVLITNY